MSGPCLRPGASAAPVRTARRLTLALLFASVLALPMLPACSPKSTLAPNAPPETYLFVQGAVDTVNHRIHLYWYGTDPDGQVVAYDYRMISGSNPDTSWIRLSCARVGVCTDSTFTVYTGDSIIVNPVFQFRAIDNDGAVDATPASQQFPLRNLPPVVKISDALRTSDSTYASVTFHWLLLDADGGGPGLRYRIWLDGNAANYDSTGTEVFTVPSQRFLKNGAFTAGLRTVYVQAVDDGGSIGPPDSMRWYVRAPAVMQRNNRGRVLLIDDVPSGGQANASFDPFYAAGLVGTSGRLLADSGSVLRLQFNPFAFRSAADFAQTLRQFEAVVWYRGLETTVSPLITSYQDSLRAWLYAGGRLYLDGLYLIAGQASPGAFREDQVLPVFGSNRLYLSFAANLQDSTAGWGNKVGSRFRSSRYNGQMSAAFTLPGQQGSTPGMRGFQVVDTSLVALWALDGQLDPPNTGYDLPVGVRIPYPGGGQLVSLSLPIRTAVPAQSNPLYLAIVRDLLLP